MAPEVPMSATTPPVPKTETEMRTFDPGDPIHVRAQQVWMILVHHALLKQKVTYQTLAVMMGFGPDAARVTIKPVAIVAFFCEAHGLPQLNAIVVRKDSGEPGCHVILGPDGTSDAQEKVFAFDWLHVRVPTPGTFRTLWAEFGG